MDKLKPCPFCGGESEIEHRKIFGGDNHAVVCKRCHINGPIDAFRAQAIENWNTRPGVEQAVGDGK